MDETTDIEPGLPENEPSYTSSITNGALSEGPNSSAALCNGSNTPSLAEIAPGVASSTDGLIGQMKAVASTSCLPTDATLHSNSTGRLETSQSAPMNTIPPAGDSSTRSGQQAANCIPASARYGHGVLFTWGGDFSWIEPADVRSSKDGLPPKKDNHKGCLGHGDMEGRLSPCAVGGDLEGKSVVQVSSVCWWLQRCLSIWLGGAPHMHIRWTYMIQPCSCHVYTLNIYHPHVVVACRWPVAGT